MSNDMWLACPELLPFEKLIPIAPKPLDIFGNKRIKVAGTFNL
jgi:hypothetical protein